MKRHLHKFYFIQFDTHMNLQFAFLLTPNVLALMIFPLKVMHFTCVMQKAHLLTLKLTSISYNGNCSCCISVKQDFHGPVP